MTPEGGEAERSREPEARSAIRTRTGMSADLQLLLDSLAHGRDQLVERKAGRRPGRLTVAAPAEPARDHRDVNRAVGRTHADLVRAVAVVGEQLAHEQRDLRALDRAKVIDD